MLIAAYDWLLQLLFPRRCPVCDGIVMPFGEKICLGCIPKLRYVTPPRCLKCGKKIANAAEEYCPDCMNRAQRGLSEHAFVSGRSLYEYDSVAPSIYRFKYGGRREYAAFFGEELARYLGEYIRDRGIEGLIPVPLHRSRQRKRGYNQAKLLAKSLSGYTGVPVYDKILVRTKNTLPMKRLNPAERQNNLKKAFNIRQNDVKLKVVLLIDDIYTTGTTVDAAARVLLAAGVEQVYFLTLACGRGL